MIIGDTLLANANKYYGPWLPGEGNAATFAIETIANGASTTFAVDVQTKNRDEPDPGSGTTIGSFEAITGTGTSDLHATGVKQLVRLQYAVSGAGSFRFVHFRVASVAWEAN